MSFSLPIPSCISLGVRRAHLPALLLCVSLSVPLFAQQIQQQVLSISSLEVATETAVPDAAYSHLPLQLEVPEIQKGVLEPRYPVLAERYGVEGRVMVEFGVDEAGRAAYTVIHQSVGYGCDREVLRVIRQARFVPVSDTEGNPVPARYLMSFVFRLDE
ncbi:MAG: energy transducer TonB [Bacteroidota bacterium]